MQDYRDRIQSGEDIDLDFELSDNPHVVASLLKMFFSELDEPLITFEWVTITPNFLKNLISLNSIIY